MKQSWKKMKETLYGRKDKRNFTWQYLAMDHYSSSVKSSQLHSIVLKPNGSECYGGWGWIIYIVLLKWWKLLTDKGRQRERERAHIIIQIAQFFHMPTTVERQTLLLKWSFTQVCYTRRWNNCMYSVLSWDKQPKGTFIFKQLYVDSVVSTHCLEQMV